jgi:hypothetical protein
MIVENARPTTLQERPDTAFAAVLIHGFAGCYSDLPLLVGEFSFFRFSTRSSHAIVQEAAIADKHIICSNRSGRIVIFWLDFFCEIFTANTADKAIISAKVER